jgi:hypothetical protein
MGEDYDARMELTGWSTSDFEDKSWEPVTVFDDPGIAFGKPLDARATIAVLRRNAIDPHVGGLDNMTVAGNQSVRRTHALIGRHRASPIWPR